MRKSKAWIGLLLALVTLTACAAKPMSFRTVAGQAFAKSGANPILRGIPGTWEEIIESPLVLKVGKTYYMFYHGINPKGYPAGYQIGLALADAPAGPWQRYSGNPVLRHGQKGDWDEFAVANAIVHEIDGTYYMWYSGQNLGVPDNYNIGLATAPAPEGPWTKYPGSPILTVGKTPDWDYEGLYASGIVNVKGIYYLYYSGFQEKPGLFDYAQQVGLATAKSPEGPWAKYPQPVIRPGAAGSWDQGAAGEADVIYRNGLFHAFYWGSKTLDPAPDRAIGYAYSQDGVNWTKYAANPLVDSGLSPEPRLSEPHVLIEGDNIYLFCTQYDGFGLYTGSLN